MMLLTKENTFCQGEDAQTENYFIILIIDFNVVLLPSVVYILQKIYLSVAIITL